MQRLKKDELYFLELRNKNYIKNISINKSKINPKSHKKWFIKQLNSKNELFVIKNKKKIGYLRLNYITKNLFEISIAISKKFHNNNIGSIALSLIEKNFLKNLFKLKYCIKTKIQLFFLKKIIIKSLKKQKNIYF